MFIAWPEKWHLLVFVPLAVLQIVFLVIKMNGNVDWSWSFVFLWAW